MILVRLLGGDQINDILVILLDDIERTFEAEEENLANMNLKVENYIFFSGFPNKTLYSRYLVII